MQQLDVENDFLNHDESSPSLGFLTETGVPWPAFWFPVFIDQTVALN
jgi:hypothetical protein